MGKSNFDKALNGLKAYWFMITFIGGLVVQATILQARVTELEKKIEKGQPALVESVANLQDSVNELRKDVRELRAELSRRNPLPSYQGFAVPQKPILEPKT